MCYFGSDATSSHSVFTVQPVLPLLAVCVCVCVYILERKIDAHTVFNQGVGGESKQ